MERTLLHVNRLGEGEDLLDQRIVRPRRIRRQDSEVPLDTLQLQRQGFRRSSRQRGIGRERRRQGNPQQERMERRQGELQHGNQFWRHLHTHQQGSQYAEGQERNVRNRQLRDIHQGRRRDSSRRGTEVQHSVQCQGCRFYSKRQPHRDIRERLHPFAPC